MTNFRYLSTDLISGQVLADSIPLQVQEFSTQLSSTGSLTGQLDLQQNIANAIAASQAAGQNPLTSPLVVNAPYLAALTPRKSVLWVLADNVPCWVGVVWDWPDMTRQDGGPLSISAQTIDSVFTHRLITDTLEYPQVDLFTAFTDLVTYGQSKNSDYISNVSPPAVRPPQLLQIFRTNGGIARLHLPSVTAGVPWTASYTWSDLTQVSDAWSDMTQSGDFDYAFIPGLDSNGDLAIYIQLGYTQLGRQYTQAGYSLTYPGNCSDYGYQATGSQGANWIWATAPPNGSAEQWQSTYPAGVDAGDLAEGFPVMESTVSWEGSTVTSQSQINSFANGQLPLYSQAMLSPTINIPDGVNPGLADITLGDSVNFSATSPLHPPVGPGQQPGLQIQVRVTGVTMYPPGPSQSAYMQLTTSGISLT